MCYQHSPNETKPYMFEGRSIQSEPYLSRCEAFIYAAIDEVISSRMYV